MKCTFSIIIPYFNKPYEVNLMLKALTLQDYDIDNVEIIIVDDGSDKRIDDIIDKYRSHIRISYIYLSHKGNRSFVRNYGARLSNGERLIFLDCDMVPAKTLISEFDRITCNEPKVVGLGWRTCLFKFDKDYITEQVLEDNFEIFASLPGTTDERSMARVFEEQTGMTLSGKWELLYSHCFCVWKREFDASGGFDIDFGVNWGGEDVELGYRLYHAGCTFVINYNANCYHIEHPVDRVGQITSLQENYQIFLEKHPDWRVELYIREFEIWVMEHILIEKKIEQREFLVALDKDVEPLIEQLPDKTLIAGIENEQLLNSDKVEQAFIPESRFTNRDKIKNIIGLSTDYEDGYFKLALVSDKYENVNYGLYTMLIKELSRIAEEVTIVYDRGQRGRLRRWGTWGRYSVPTGTVLGPDGDGSRYDGDGSRYDGDGSRRWEPFFDTKTFNYKKDLNVLFSLNTEIHSSYTRYYYANLALATSKMGIRTGIQLLLDVDEHMGLNTGYLRFSNPKKVRMLQKINKHELNFIGDQIPCFMDSYDSQFVTRALPNRILWEEFIGINQIAKLKKSILKSYNHVFVKRKWEQDYYKDIIETDYLPVGIDTEKIRDIKSTTDICTDNPFTFLWTDRYTSKDSNLKVLLEAFNEVFENNSQVQLKIVIPGNFIPVNNTDRHFVTDSYFNEYETWLMTEKSLYDANLNRLMEKYRTADNIVFITNVFDDEVYSRELYVADCFIHLNAKMEICPLVLESIAFGKKPIIPDDNRYADYFNPDFSFRIKTSPVSKQYTDDMIDLYDENKFILVNQPLKDSIKTTLLRVCNDKDLIAIDDRVVNDFIGEFDWLKIADDLKPIIKNMQ